MRARLIGILLLGLLLPVFAGCMRSSFEPPQMQGEAAMVESGGQLRLWLLTKLEEKRMRSIGGGRRSTPTWHTDTYYHFEVEAIDPATTKTLWKQRLVSFGDPKAASTDGPARVIGSAESAQLLGQDGEVVWLLVGDAPYAVSASDGHVLVDGPGVEAANPALKGLLPSEARLYGFDHGLVFMSADARQFVVRGPQHQASEYTPPPPPAQQVTARVKANGMPEIVPMRPPMGEVPARQAQLGGAWLGLYSQKEAADLLDDSFGNSLRYPYTILDEGSLARRGFLRAKIVQEKRFDESFARVAELSPVAQAPVFLKGRFFKQPGGGDDAMVLENPAGLLVWHSTRMDDAGRLALARVDESLQVLWKAELPLSETDAVRRIATWVLPGRIVAVGELRTQDEGGVHHRDPYLASVDLATGAVASRNLSARE